MNSLLGSPLVNLATSNDQIPDIEQQIRVVEERCRDNWNSLPFQKMSKILKIHIVLNSVKISHFFPTKGGISDYLSPKNIISVGTLDYKITYVFSYYSTARCTRKKIHIIVRFKEPRELFSLFPAGIYNADTCSWL